MVKLNHDGFLVIFLVLCHLAFPPKAYAYLDPGSGSYVLQIVFAFLLGGVVSLKIYWRKIRDFFRKKQENEKGEE